MKLSIITINYNDVNGLRKTIDSVLAQTWTDFEWIIIDGGSTDGSREVIEQKQKHLSFWCSEPDKGVYNALNKGIAHANGKYICCMNAGDCFYESETLTKVFEKEHDEDILYGDWEEVYPNEIILKHEPYPIDFHVFCHQNICHQAMFVKSTHLKQRGFDESYKLLADYARWTEMLLAKCSIAFVDCIVCRYDMGGISSTNLELALSESKRIQAEIVPPCIYPMLEELDYYVSICAFARLKLLLNNGGIQSKIICGFLKLMDRLFLHYDFATQNKLNCIKTKENEFFKV